MILNLLFAFLLLFNKLGNVLVEMFLFSWEELLMTIARILEPQDTRGSQKQRRKNIFYYNESCQRKK